MTAGSGRNPPGRRGGRPRLSDEDRSLWQRIASTIDPLRRAKPRTPEVEAPPDPDVAAARAPGRSAVTSQGPLAVPGQTAPTRSSSSKQAAPPPRPQLAPRRHEPPPVPAVERRTARRIASGTIEIDARLDLHGLTQSAAHGRLIAFLQGAAARGFKTVLVITGKGAAARERARLDRGGREPDDYGVLRRSVPRWLAEAPLRALVISYQTAAPRHGGEGAFYVLIRRNRRSGER